MYRPLRAIIMETYALQAKLNSVVYDYYYYY